MDIASLLSAGANLIQQNSDSATSNLDSNQITDALGGIFGEGGGGIAQILSGAAGGGLGDIVSSWVGSGDNQAISADSITELLGADKVSQFASSLGLSEESAKNALAEVLPGMVDKMSPGEGGLESLLASVGGTSGILGMMGKMFK